MQIRIVKETELWSVLNFSAQMFWKQDLVRCTEDGKNRFMEFLKYEHQLEKFQAGEILLFAAFEQEKICGAMELDTKGNVLFLYTDSMKHAERIAGRMIQEACKLAHTSGMYQTLSAEVMPEKEPFYRQLGFFPCAENIWEDGVQKCPVQLDIESKLARNTEKKNSNTWIYIAIGAGAAVLALLLLVGLLVSFIIRQPQREQGWNYSAEDSYPDDEYWEDDDIWGDGNHGDNDEFWDDGDFDDEWDGDWDDNDGDNYSDDAENDGILTLDAYIDPGAGYEAKERIEEFQSDDASSYLVAYDVKYPEIAGLPENIQNQVNEVLKNCAMETVDKYYANPSEETKEWMLRQQYAIVISQVDYIVSYMDENLLAVAFEDWYSVGNYNSAHIGLRSVIINVNDGTVYEPEDVLEMNRDFAKMWKREVMSEYGEDEFVGACNIDNLVNMFHGRYESDGIRPALILTEDGVEIGFEYRMPGENAEDTTGYITVAFEKEDLRPYQKSSEFWKMVKND